MNRKMLITALALIALPSSLAQTATPTPALPTQQNAPLKQRTRAEIVQGLIRIGEQAIVRQDDAALDAYFSKDFVFHGPLGDLNLPALKKFWAASRAAFSEYTITRGRIVVEGDFVASQTTFSGVFEREFTQSPVGALPPTGKRFTQNIINIFRYDKDGRLAEEWVQYDVRDYLRQLGAEGK
ncbi:ester cyclase [Deinococcus sp. Arct2-2]|uniref:ester cyclase n=1 Tax=Deinococcus sp. Arct2-2 TaxID=2568653 RepID=UPI0010A4B5FC|nr:ester cyclase [Deinococcus sp. Arct2-2]THF69573.1 ester cyclase [Deinococcus sp. Arct2-2]